MFKYEEFKSCPMEYRSAPFWSWNDKMEKEEIIRQIHEMQKQGIGGFFMHPRGGMKDRYLGKDFMDAIEIAVSEARKLGMKAWLYDEDRFPSGSAGGMVVEGNPEYGAKVLEVLEIPCNEIKKTDSILRICLPEEENGVLKYEDITKMSQDEISGMDRTAWLFRIVYKGNQSNCNNKPYTDLCYKEAVDRFIEITHERYSQKLKEDFGDTIPGIFTDEPNFNPSSSGKSYLPWTYEFERHFEEQKGYCITDHLPQLFFETGNYKKVRFDFWDTFTQLFSQSYVKNVYDWCEKNGICSTGHFWEHAFPNPAHSGSVMPHYEFMQYPGIDILFNTEEEIEQVGNDLIVKEVASVGNQLGKKRVLSETFGASGWDMDFAEMKRVADWQFALGINLMCQHLVLYSMEGYRKRDFPPSYLDHQPYWDSYHLIGDYLGRMSYIMSQGEYKCDILVLHPSSSTWAEFNILDDDNPQLNNISRSLEELVRKLCQQGYLFDLGDDIIMERHGRAEDGKLIIGDGVYSTVIVPHMTLMRGSNYKMIREFVDGGGKLISTGINPNLLDGNHDIGLEDFFKGDQIIRCGEDDLTDVLSQLGNDRIYMENADGSKLQDIYSHKRIAGDRQIIFLSNYSRNQKYEIRLQMDSSFHRVERWDGVSGKRERLSPYDKDGKRYIDLVFYPAGSHLLILDKDRKGNLMGQDKRGSEESIWKQPLEKWKAIKKDYNALTINRCSISIDDGVWSEFKNVVATNDEVRRRLGLDIGNIFAPQPWTYTKEEKTGGTPLRARYRFTLLEALRGNLYVAAEYPDTYRVIINGNEVKPNGKTFKDRAFVMYDIKGHVSAGENEIILSTDKYGILTSIESIYILGDFKVMPMDNGFGIAEETGILPGDWTKQGYYFYSGAMEYVSSFELSGNMIKDHSVRLDLDDLWGVAFRIYVNEQEAAVLGWQPYEVDITDYVKPGKNRIVVQVMNSLQNLLGPHDYQDVEGIITPGSFYSEVMVKFTKSGFGGKASIIISKG